VWFDSPVAFSSSKAVVDSVRDSVVDSVVDSVWGSVVDSVRDSVRGSVWGSVRDSVWGSVRGSVGASVWGSVRDSVRDSVRAWYWADDMSFYKFFNDNLEQNDLEHLCLFTELVNGFYVTADTAYLVRKPIRLVRNQAGRLHYDHDKAIEWADGTGFYYLHGVKFKKEDWERIVSQDVTLSEFAQMGLNNEQRPAALQMLRPDRLLEQVHAKLVNTGKRGVELYEVPNFMDTGDTEYCLKMEHPSIEGKLYLEWVQPKVGRKHDADLAMASNRSITKQQYLEALIA
jgi:hypothetical protein